MIRRDLLALPRDAVLAQARRIRDESQGEAVCVVDTCTAAILDPHQVTNG